MSILAGFRYHTDIIILLISYLLGLSSRIKVKHSDYILMLILLPTPEEDLNSKINVSGRNIIQLYLFYRISSYYLRCNSYLSAESDSESSVQIVFKIMVK